MKKLILFVLVLSALACKKAHVSIGDKILMVTVNGKTEQSFEYDQNNRLISENAYSQCAIPSEEYVYTYKDGRLEKINTVHRGLYSSTSDSCDPLKGFKSEQVFSYDNSGRIHKVTNGNIITESVYNQQGF